MEGSRPLVSLGGRTCLWRGGSGKGRRLRVTDPQTQTIRQANRDGETVTAIVALWISAGPWPIRSRNRSRERSRSKPIGHLLPVPFTCRFPGAHSQSPALFRLQLSGSPSRELPADSSRKAAGGVGYTRLQDQRPRALQPPIGVPDGRWRVQILGGSLPAGSPPAALW